MFSVSPYPDVVSITPSDGAVDVLPEEERIHPNLTRLSVVHRYSSKFPSHRSFRRHTYSYYSPYNQELMLSWFKEPMTQYTITVGTDIEDQYGNTLGEDRQFTFTTGDYSHSSYWSLTASTISRPARNLAPAWSIEMSTSL